MSLGPLATLQAEDTKEAAMPAGACCVGTFLAVEGLRLKFQDVKPAGDRKCTLLCLTGRKGKGKGKGKGKRNQARLR